MSLPALKQVIEKHWGFRSFRPLQERAMKAVLDGRDSVVVMPTGGGKSLCYQAPAVVRGGITVVLSPLIALMKDQVDGLQANGVPAIQLDSSLSSQERYENEMKVRRGEVHLLFISPERLMMPDFFSFLKQVGVKTFAIDEAHCISHWGHDFRPEYRQLARIKQDFPEASVHAYTATATARVQQDIVTQLALKNPEVLVGNFDRPNLNYRVLPRLDLDKQVIEVLDRHKNEAGIIYCIRRKDVDELADMLKTRGYKCMGYHAGLTPDERRRAQDAFAEEECDIIVATIAFGMGIDRSNIRFVLHTGMPKSIEHYQQETGRAGRDGLEAECVLLHSGQDFQTWKFIINKSVEEGKADRKFLASATKHLNEIDSYCRGMVCRHRALVEYFGQTYEPQNCAACDVCLGDTESVPDADIIAMKVLSCVARVQESFGANHVASVLHGANLEKIRSLGHDKLSTYGLLKEYTIPAIRDWIYQLIGQAVLVQDGDEYPVLRLNDASWEVMKKQRSVKLRQPVKRKKDERAKSSQAEAASWEGVDRDLFEELRTLRRDLAHERNVPPYIIFSDNTLRDLARVRPSTVEKMHVIYGVGERKLEEFGNAFLQTIKQFCETKKLSMDNALTAPAPPRELRRVSTQGAARLAKAFDLFRAGKSVDDAAAELSLSPNTLLDYLADFIRKEKPKTISHWVPDEMYQRIAKACKDVGTERLKPIFVELGEKVPYDLIRLVVAHLTA